MAKDTRVTSPIQRQTLEDVRVMFDKYGNEMMGKGWDLDVAAMETRAGTRLQIGVQQVG
jgi:hypothetical protein